MLFSVPEAARTHLVIVFNSSFFWAKEEDNVENPFKLQQLEELFQLKKLCATYNITYDSYEMDVANEEKVNKMFDDIAKKRKFLLTAQHQSLVQEEKKQSGKGKSGGGGKGKGSKAARK